MRISNLKFQISSFRAFTILELLVAVAVLALVLVFITQAIGAVSRTWRIGVARTDNFAKARVVLGLLDRDIGSAVLRRDLGAFVDEAGAPACAFYSRIGGQADRRLSLVRYSLTNSTDGPVLQRADYGLDYAANTLTLGTTNSLPGLRDAAGQDVAGGILRFEWQFLAADGTLQPTFHFDYDTPGSASNTRALVVSVLVLDDNALRLAQQTGKLGDLLGKFSGTPEAGQTYAQVWNAALDSPAFGQNLPEPLSAGARVFERHIALP
ncbi:MAG: hypothetical protein WC003_08415 [Terrimicrobiaceae bacterium]